MKPLLRALILVFLNWGSSLCLAHSDYCVDQLSLKKLRPLVVPASVRKNTAFITNSRLQDYFMLLHEDFKKSLAALGPADTWIDLGGGKGYAVEDYLRSRSKISEPSQVVLITYVLGRLFGISNYKGKIKLIEGRLFEEIERQELPKAKLFSDVRGITSYTQDLSTTLRTIFDRFAENAEYYIHSSNYHTSIDTPHGVISLTTFLERIPGLKVEGRFGIIKVTKKTDQIVVPNLILTRYDNSLPPYRRFKLEE